MVIYLCDCNKNSICNKSSCEIFCKGTLNIDYAKLDDKGNAIVLEVTKDD